MKIKTLLLTGLIVMIACDESKYDLENIVPEAYHKILYVNNSGKQEVTLYDIEDDYEYTLSIIQSGSEPDQTASANIRLLTQAEVESRYSEPEAIDYQIISEDSYSLETTQVNFSVFDRYKLVTIALKPQVIKAILENAPATTWVLPLEISSETDSVNAEKNELFLQILDVVSPTLGFTDPSLTVKQYEYGSLSTLSESIKISLDVENKWEIEWEIETDESYISTYNSANGTLFQAFPAGTYTLPESMSLPYGTTTTELTVTIQGAQLIPGDYMLPLRIKNISLFEIASDRALYPLAIRIMGPQLDRTGWTAEANTEEPSGEGVGNGIPSCLLDGNLSTYWHSAWQSGNTPLPHEIIIDAKQEYTFTQLGLVQRQHDDYNDTAGGDFYISSDKETWTKVGSFTMEQILDTQIFGITPTTGRYIKISITKSYRDPNCSLAEVYAYGLK